MRPFQIKSRPLRITARIFGAITALLLLAWTALGIYVQSHKAELLKEITARLSTQVQGQLSIRDMEPSFWKSFPDISITLKDVTLRDSLWDQHHHSLLDVKDLFVKVNTLGLLSRRVEIVKLTAAHGSAYLYADSTGYSNGYMMARRDTTKKNRTALIEKFGLEDFHFYYINLAKKKDFHLYFSSLDGTTFQNLGVMHFRIKSAAHVYNMAFSTVRGSYLRDQDLQLDEKMDYIIDQKRLVIPEQPIGIGKESIRLSAVFFLDRVPSAFEMHIHAPPVPFAAAKNWMAQNTAKVVGPYSFSKPIEAWVDINGSMQYHTIPLVRIRVAIRDNVMSAPLGNIEKMSADLQFYNEAVSGRGHGDDNTEIRLTSLSGSWQKLPFSADTIAVRNLIVPSVDAHVRSDFPLVALDGLLGAETFSFKKGAAAADLHYVGGILADDTSSYSLNGYMQLSDATVTYLPRSISFSDAKATILFEGDNLYLRDVAIHTRASSISMEGEALHFLRLYFSDPGKILLSWRARSPQIDLNEFTSFAARRQEVKAGRGTTGAVSRFGTQLDKVLDASSIAIDAKVDRLLLKSFTATGAIVKATLAQTGIIIEKVALQNAGGSVELSGVIHQSQSQNPFSINAVMNNVDVAATFKSFSNFGQDAISGDNLRGKLNLNASLTGGITEGGSLIKNSLNGKVNLMLEDGELNNYAPFEKISRFIFKKRNLDHLTFKDLKTELDVNGSNITIRPMQIQSSAIEMKVAGVYNLNGKGTDIAMEIPLRNPAKEKAKTPIGMLLRTGKGVVVHLRAQDGGAGGVKIGWDPMHKGKELFNESMKLD